MRYRIIHHTEYCYAEPVVLCHSEARLVPRDMPGQSLQSAPLEISPPPAVYAEREDFFGNRVASFVIQQPHTRLTVRAVNEVNVDLPPAWPSESPPWDAVWGMLQSATEDEARQARQFTLESPFVPIDEAFRAYALPEFATGRPVLDAIRGFVARIHREFTFDPAFTAVGTPLLDVLASRRGVCQDLAHIAIAGLRSLGLPARYVSGYVETVPPPGLPRLAGADASHAWMAAFVPGLGWLDFDPTNDAVPAGQHITVGWGRDFGDVTPLKGVVAGGGAHALSVAVDVERLASDA